MDMKKFLKVALGTSLFILDQSDRARKNVRERVGNQVDDLRDVAQANYQVAADRIGRVADTIRGYDTTGPFGMLFVLPSDSELE